MKKTGRPARPPRRASRGRNGRAGREKKEEGVKMTKKDLTMLRKAIGREDPCPIAMTASCYVEAETKATTYQEPELFEREEDERADQFRAFMKKALTGRPGVTALDVKPKANLLERARRDGLEDDEAVRAIAEAIAESYRADEDYAVFVAKGEWDVPAQGGGESEISYDFVLVTIQPCALSKSGIVYDRPKNSYVGRMKDRPLGAPAHAFLWPSFDEGAPDAGVATCFSKTQKAQPEIRKVAEALFGSPIPLSPEEQKAAFDEMAVAASGGGAGVAYEDLKRAYGRFAEIAAEAEVAGAEGRLTAKELADIIKDEGSMDEETLAAVDAVAEKYRGEEFALGALAPKAVAIDTEAAKLKVGLNDVTELDVIEWKGRRCLAVPLYGAKVEGLDAR